MKRIAAMLLALMMIFTFAACSNGNGGPSKADSKLLFVGQNNEADVILLKRLQDTLGYNVTVVSDEDLTTEEAVKYDLIIISNTATRQRVGGKVKQVEVPILHMNASVTFSHNLIARSSDGGSEDYQTKIKIKDSTHPIASGLSGTIDAYQLGGKIGYGIPGETATVIATVENDDKKAAIYAYEKGVKDAGILNTTVPSRQVFFFLVAGEEANLTDDAKKLFDAALQYALEG